MSAFDLELLTEEHDRKAFRCGSESLERYLRETARGHLAKGVSITRVLVERNAVRPKPILGYFTLTSTLAKAVTWPGAAKGPPERAFRVSGGYRDRISGHSPTGELPMGKGRG